jgi:hypothetical protein
MTLGGEASVTESEWAECRDTQAMLAFVGNRASDRKLRLFAAACCRRAWHLFSDERGREAVEAAERYADHLLAEADREKHHRLAKAAVEADWRKSRKWTANRWACKAAATSCTGWSPALGASWDAANALAQGVIGPGPWPYRTREWCQEITQQTALLRCICGNPFRTISAEVPWRTTAVRTLARAADAERRLPGGELDPAHLAVLADALAEAGCTDAQLLGHLRGPGPHVRGCWAVDLLLAKE